MAATESSRFSLPQLRSVRSMPTIRHIKGKLSLGLVLKPMPRRPEDITMKRATTWKKRTTDYHFRYFSIRAPVISSPASTDNDSPRSLIYAQVYCKTAIGSLHGIRKKHNQDAYFDEAQNESRLIGICDGHGAKGHIVSRFVSEHLPQLVFSKLHRLENTEICEGISAAYHECSQMLKVTKHDLSTSGCASLSLLFTGSTVFCASLGHARAISGRLTNGIWSVYQFSLDHRPDQEKEMSRILDRGGEVSVSKRMHVGPARVYLKGTQLPGLCISRALGDTAVEDIGVLHDPEITVFQPTVIDRFLLIATYGLWEVMSSVEAMRMVAKHMKLSPEHAPADLVQEAQRRWKERGGLVDDITVLLVVLNA